MSQLTETKVFNRTDAIVESWYWAFKSKDLKKGQIKRLNFVGQEIVIYRGLDNIVRATQAYCPHMGAHLAEGKVDGKGIRCFFHAWKFDEKGELVDIPCRQHPGIKESIRTFPVKERYNTIWVYNGDSPTHDVHSIDELDGQELDVSYGNSFTKACHPNVVMINAIDAHHFTSVHKMPLNVKFKTTALSQNRIMFDNITTMPKTKWYLRFLGRFYANHVTYRMIYTSGSTGSVSIGPDFLHFHIIFALRMTPEGKTKGLTLAVTQRRKGFVGKIINPILLFATKCVGNYFAKGDTEVFNSIRFNFNRPIKEDESIIKFIQHLEQQPLASSEKRKEVDKPTSYSRAETLSPSL